MIFQLVFLLFHVVSLIVPAWMRKGGPGPAFLKGSASIWQILLEWGNQTVSYQENWRISVSQILCGSQTRFQLNQTIIWKDIYERKRLFCFPQKMKQIDFQSEYPSHPCYLGVQNQGERSTPLPLLMLSCLSILLNSSGPYLAHHSKRFGFAYVFTTEENERAASRESCSCTCTDICIIKQWSLIYPTYFCSFLSPLSHS